MDLFIHLKTCNKSHYNRLFLQREEVESLELFFVTGKRGRMRKKSKRRRTKRKEKEELFTNLLRPVTTT